MTTLMLADHLKVAVVFIAIMLCILVITKLLTMLKKNALWSNENSHAQITSLEDFAAGETFHKVYHNDTLYSAMKLYAVLSHA